MSALVWSLVLALYTSLSSTEANTKRTWYIRQSYSSSARVIPKPPISYRVRWYQSPVVDNDNTRMNMDPVSQSRTVRVGSSGSYNTERAKSLRMKQTGLNNTERAKRLRMKQSGVNNTERAKILRMKQSGVNNTERAKRLRMEKQSGVNNTERAKRLRMKQSGVNNTERAKRLRMKQSGVNNTERAKRLRMKQSGVNNTERAKRLRMEKQSGVNNTERAKRLRMKQSGVNNTERAKKLRMKQSGGKEQGVIVNKQQKIKPVVKSKPTISSKFRKKNCPYPRRRFQQKAEKDRTKFSKRTHVKKKVSIQTPQLTITGNGKTTTKYAGNKMRKPSKTKSKSALSPAEKAEVVTYHNKARRNVYPPSSNMRKVEWDDVLADVAERYASRCLGVHNDARHTQQSKFSTLGENIYHTWNWEYYKGQKNILPLNLTQGMDLWESEKRFFNYFSPNNCPVSRCGHYTQMVRDVSYAVGCGKHFCHSVVFDGKPLHDVHVLICNYGEGYNNKAVPYEKGRSCSQCGDGFSKCVNGLTLGHLTPDWTFVRSLGTKNTKFS